MLLHRIDAYLRRTRTPPTRFGRDAMGDPHFVLNLRDGRQPRVSTAERVHRYLDEREPPLDTKEEHR
jgi:hypothetical protein